MSKSFVLAAVLTLASAGPVLAQSACMIPIAPAPIDGATVTLDQLHAARGDVMNFISQSDVYQDCLGKEIDAAKAKAKADKTPFDNSIATTAMAKADDNQKMKEKVGAEFNAATVAYKKAHPAP